MRSKQKGFTLIELLVVIAIIGLLSTLAVVALTSARAKARDAKRISDVKQTQTALELYFADQGQKYPAGTDLLLGVTPNLVLCGGTAAKGFQPTVATCQDTGATTFMGKVPKDPNSDATAVCGGDVVKDCNYKYSGTESDTRYAILFALEGKSGDLAAGLNCATQDGMKSGATCP
ncbi:MAG: type II secretion system protein [bacterium]|nr:type II secretion system protein [bacterium]